MIGGDLDEHIPHAYAFGDQWPNEAPPATVVDLGSGGGLPSMVLMARWPETEFLLAETRQKRADVLERARRKLDAQDRVSVWPGDVQDAIPEYAGWADLVTARSFGPPTMVAECAAALLKLGGHLIVSEPPNEATDARWPAAELGQLGMERVSHTQEPYGFVVLRKTAETPTQFPRRRRTMDRSPLW